MLRRMAERDPEHRIACSRRLERGVERTLRVRVEIVENQFAVKHPDRADTLVRGREPTGPSGDGCSDPASRSGLAGRAAPVYGPLSRRVSGRGRPDSVAALVGAEFTQRPLAER